MAKSKGIQLGRPKGSKGVTKREKHLKKKLQSHSKVFGGSLLQEVYKCSKSTLVEYEKGLRGYVTIID